ncbi:MAG: hypothetical protein FWD17_06190 [Polyangiaceae bacterium]|nr:hypothetical protein [Polyangiaceae bacterium]
MRYSGLVAALVLAGCAHAESFDGGVLRKGGLRIELGPVPETWRRISVRGADLAFRDDKRAGSTLFNVHCGGRDDDAPLGILTQNLIMGTTERDFESQEIMPFDGREAMRTRLRAKLDGVPMQYEIYVMKKDGCVYDLVYVAPPDRFEDGTADFERFAGGLRTAATPTAVGGGTGATSRDP